MKKRIQLVVLAMSVFFIGACGKQTTDTTSDRSLTVVTTFYPMYEFTKQVVGSEGTVSLLIPAGTEPHDYEPSAKDMAKIVQADAFVYNSDALESWVDQVSDNIDTKKTAVIQAAKGITLLDEAEEEGLDTHDHVKDPHVWLDPVLAKQEVVTIAEQLSKKYPAKKAVFMSNAAAYTQKLDQLHQSYEQAFASAKNKTFVVQHAAFGYLAKRYGLTQAAISGVSSDQEPSPSKLAELNAYVQKHDVQVIYMEDNASSKVAETLAQETNVSLAVLNTLESLTKEQQENGESYLSVMEQNLQALKESIR